MSSGISPIKNALISVSNKDGLELLCPFLQEQGIKIYSTEGTADYLAKKFKIEAVSISSVTQFPEMLGGRVKTLHPKVFGGVLARREESKDLNEVKEHAIPLFDLVVVNLYPFHEHLDENPYEQAQFIDIGGPSLIRAAAKNSRSVCVLSDPLDYTSFMEEVKRLGGTTAEFRHQMAGKSFQRTSKYDAMIAGEWVKNSQKPTSLCFLDRVELRYGENPHQKAFWSNEVGNWKCLQGKELSFNNLLDSEAAIQLAYEFSDPSIAIIKHNNPCGVSSSQDSLITLFQKALSTDEKSAFGGIVATNRSIDKETAEKMSSLFLEVIIAPQFTEDAKIIFSQKKNLRLIEWKEPRSLNFEVKAAMGGWLVQSTDSTGIPVKFDCVTQKKPTVEMVVDMKFAWLVCKHVKSNAIVLAKNGKTLGIGAGQMSRVDSVNIALNKCHESIQGAVLASDAFFPFRDNIDLLKGKGISAIIQPGGSQRDGEVIQACNELGIAMIFTGERHFRH